MTDILQDAEPGQQLDVGLYVGLNVEIPATPEEEWWAGQVVDHLRASLESIVSAGRTLIEAKAELPHGSWLPMLRLAGVGVSKAEALMKIARHPVLGDPQHVGILPASWGTLSELARLTEDEALGALESGAIRPDLTRPEALDLVRPAPAERDLGDEDHTSDEEKVPKIKDYAEARDAAVFSAKQAHVRLADCLRLIKTPGFRLTVEVAQDIQRELNKVDKVYGDLLLSLDEEVGFLQRAPRNSSVVIPAASKPVAAGSGGLKAGRTEVSLGGQSDHIGDTTITLETYNEREGR